MSTKNPKSKITPSSATPSYPPVRGSLLPNRFRGIDYSFRPASYWDDTSVLHATLRNVKGENRRRLIRDFHAAGHLEKVQPGLAQDILSDDERRSLGRIHPTFFGGEYLPDYRAGETEIARIVLASTLQDVISLRARRTRTGLLRYSIVDEYQGAFRSPRLPARTPLTLGELVDWIDQARLLGARDDGYGLGLLYTAANHDEGETADEIETFTTVDSDLYPSLRDHYARLSSEWVTRQLLIHVEDQPRQDILQALVDAGRAPHLASAAHTLRRHAPHLHLNFREE